MGESAKARATGGLTQLVVFGLEHGARAIHLQEEEGGRAVEKVAALVQPILKGLFMVFVVFPGCQRNSRLHAQQQQKRGGVLGFLECEIKGTKGSGY